MSRAVCLADWIDPSVLDEDDPDQRDPSLDLYHPDNKPPYSAAFLQRGLITTAHLPALGVTVASLVGPALLGMWLYTRISALAFRNVVLGLLTASGVAMLAATLPALLSQRSA